MFTICWYVINTPSRAEVVRLNEKNVKCTNSRSEEWCLKKKEKNKHQISRHPAYNVTHILFFLWFPPERKKNWRRRRIRIKWLLWLKISRSHWMHVLSSTSNVRRTFSFWQQPTVPGIRKKQWNQIGGGKSEATKIEWFCQFMSTTDMDMDNGHI